jgi:FtsH-binding integral membrane protein
MRFLTTRVHAVLDYIIGIVLIGLPFLYDSWGGDRALIWVPVGLGIGIIVYSLFTDYELSMVRAIPMPAHLVLDAVGGIILAISPFVFGFAQRTWLPYVVVGLFEVGTSLVTRTRPEPAGLAG